MQTTNKSRILKEVEQFQKVQFRKSNNYKGRFEQNYNINSWGQCKSLEGLYLWSCNFQYLNIKEDTVYDKGLF